ncbi:MAG TPA: hypothetical protein VF407_21850, partial [Polyangiaceae bacterium]
SNPPPAAKAVEKPGSRSAGTVVGKSPKRKELESTAKRPDAPAKPGVFVPIVFGILAALAVVVVAMLAMKK